MLKQKLDESIYEIADCVGTIQTAVVFSVFCANFAVRALLTYEKKHTCKRKYNTHV
jgi:hypothetical protein